MIASLSSLSTTGDTSSLVPTESSTRLEDFPDCGEKGTNTRIVGGTEVAPNEYPWLCSLQYQFNAGR